MPEQKTISKATLQQILWDDDGVEIVPDTEFEVQFNPETLSIALSNQVDGGDQAGGSAIQFTSKGATKLTFELFFDVTDPKIQHRFGEKVTPSNPPDVRKITKLVAAFMQTKKEGDGKETTFTPPGVRFQWGTFRFEGVVDSLSENLDFFSEQGVPLRSTLSVSMTKQDVDVQFNSLDGEADGKNKTGTKEIPSVGKDESISDYTNKRSSNKPWQGDALANGIENPRNLPMGKPLNLGSEQAESINAGLSRKAGSGAGQSTGLGGSFGESLGESIGGSAGVGRSSALNIADSGGFDIDPSTELALNSGSMSDSGFESDFNF